MDSKKSNGSFEKAITDPMNPLKHYYGLDEEEEGKGKEEVESEGEIGGLDKGEEVVGIAKVKMGRGNVGGSEDEESGSDGEDLEEDEGVESEEDESDGEIAKVKNVKSEELSYEEEDTSSTGSEEENYLAWEEENVPEIEKNETRSRLARLGNMYSNQVEMESTDEKLAREKRLKIFKARNAKFENQITMDLHGQSVIGAIDGVERNIYCFSLSGAVKSLRVITGCGNHCGNHCVGMPNIKRAVLNLCGEEGIRCTEDKENQGVLLIWFDGRTEFAFMDPENDYELKTVVCT